MLKKVLYLSYDGMTDPLGQGQALSYLKGLAALGHAVSLVSFEKKDRFETEGNYINTVCRNAGIDWHPLSYTKSPPVLSTIYDLRRMIKKAKTLHRQKQFDIVHCRGYIAGLAGLDLKRKLGLYFLFDMRGFWIDEKSEGAGGWDPHHFIYKRVIGYLRKKEKAFFHESDHIISLTQAGKDLISKQFPELSSNITVIPTCVNFEVFPPFNLQTRNSIRKKMGIPEHAFVLLYSGATGPNYDMQFLAKTFGRIKALYKDAWLMLLTKDGLSGLDGTGIKDDEHIVSLSVPYQEVGNHLMAGDLGVINYIKGLSVAGRSPTKLAEYWASGLPAIAPDGIGDVDELFAKYPGAGFTVKKDDFSQMMVLSITENDRVKLREYAKDYFSLGKGVQLYNQVYLSFTKSSKRTPERLTS